MRDAVYTPLPPYHIITGNTVNCPFRKKRFKKFERLCIVSSVIQRYKHHSVGDIKISITGRNMHRSIYRGHSSSGVWHWKGHYCEGFITHVIHSIEIVEGVTDGVLMSV